MSTTKWRCLAIVILNSHFIRLATGSFLIWNTPCSKSQRITQLPYMGFIRPVVYEP